MKHQIKTLFLENYIIIMEKKSNTTLLHNQSKFQKLTINIVKECIFPFLSPREFVMYSLLNKKIRRAVRKSIDDFKRFQSLEYYESHEIAHESTKEFMIYLNNEVSPYERINQKDIKAHSFLLYCVVPVIWKKNNYTIASCGGDKRLKIWNLETNSLVFNFELLNDWMLEMIQIIWDENDHTLLAGDSVGNFYLFDVNYLKLIKKITKFKDSKVISLSQFFFEKNKSTVLTAIGLNVFVWNFIDETIYYELNINEFISCVRQIIPDWRIYNNILKNNSNSDIVNYVEFEHLVIIGKNGYNKNLLYYDLKLQKEISSITIGQESPYNQIKGIEIKQIKYLNDKDRNVKKIIVGFKNDVRIYDLETSSLLYEFETPDRIFSMEQIYHHKNQLIFLIGQRKGDLSLITIDELYKKNSQIKNISVGSSDIYCMKQMMGSIYDKIIVITSSAGDMKFFKTGFYHQPKSEMCNIL